MRLNIDWQGGYKFFCYDSQNHQTVMDADPETGGLTCGPTPVEAYIESLAVCGAVDILVVLKKRRIKVEKFAVEVETERRDTLPKIFTKVVIKYRISGEGIDDKEMERAIKMSEEKLCTILAMIDKSQTEVKTVYEIF